MRSLYTTLFTACRTSIPILICLLACTLTNISARAQETRTEQQRRTVYVLDSLTRKPLSFASAVFHDTRKGSIADVDGRLLLKTPLPDQTLTVSRVGYRSRRFKPANLPDTILLAPESASLEAVVVKVSDESDPRADWIIRQTIKHKPGNDPDHLSNYTYTSYNKMTADANREAKKVFATPQGDTTSKAGKAKKPVDTLPRHLFVIESVIEHAYKRPLLRQETVKAQKISGLSKGYLIGLATQLQYFSFYPDNFSLLGVQYYNPVSGKYRGDYVFHMVDSFRNEDGSQTWIVSFRPHRKRFGLELLKGEIYIHENDFGIVNVIAAPNTTNAMFTLSFRQQYDQVGDHWFPAQLNTDITLGVNQNNGAQKDTTGRGAIVVNARTYLQDIHIDSTLPRARFGNYRYTLDPDVDNQSAQFWEDHRTIKLDSLDRHTYHYLDSVVAASPDIRRQQFKIDVIGDLVRGEIPMGKINLKINQLINYNEYEGLRLGLGLVTNTRFSRDVRIGAYAGYGFIDRSVKYGGLLEFPVGYNKEVTYGLSYSQDIALIGTNNFKGTPLINYQTLLSRKADSLQKIELYRKGWIGKIIQSRLYANYQHRAFTQGYFFLDPAKGTTQYKSLNLAEVGGLFSTDFKQGLLEAGNLVINSLSFERKNFLELEVRAGKSLDAEPAINYQKIELRYTRVFDLGRPGKISTILAGGKVWGDLPYGMLFSDLGTYDQFSVDIPATFQTMRWYEFVNDAYAALFFNYETGYIIQSRNKFGLSLLFAQNTGIGSLANPQLHIGVDAVPMNPVYTEGGFGLRLRTNRHNYSVLAYYRYGYYNLPKTIDNFSFRVIYQ